MILLTTIGHVKAEQKILCASYWAYKLKSNLSPETSDKYKHCTLSCWLARRCPASQVLNLGIGKELADFFGYGNAEWADLIADMQGISLAKGPSSDRKCHQGCLYYYP